jgi:hypothetical protein
MENTAALELARREKEFHYFKTPRDLELELGGTEECTGKHKLLAEVKWTQPVAGARFYSKGVFYLLPTAGRMSQLFMDRNLRSIEKIKQSSHINLYLSFWKHHQYLTPGRHCGDNCSGDWFVIGNWFWDYSLDECCENIYDDRQYPPFLADIGGDPMHGAVLHHNVGSRSHHMIESLSAFIPEWTEIDTANAWGWRMFCADREARYVYVARAGEWDDRCCIIGCEDSGDCCDLCYSGPRANQDLWNSPAIDFDHDGLLDEGDNCPYVNLFAVGTMWDTDLDGFGDVCDNCPEDRNPDQADWDGDGFGDACDNCPWLWNPSQAKNPIDTDRWGDACDLCPEQDPRCVGLNCPSFCPRCIHPIRRDFDATLSETSDLIGMVIDNAYYDMREMYDWDGDTIGNNCDNCPDIPNMDQWNCNYDWEVSTRAEETFEEWYDEVIAGDACDYYDPCVTLDDYPIRISSSADGGYLDMSMRAPGYRTGAPDYVKDVMKGYCDCGIYHGYDFELCRTMHSCTKTYEVASSWVSPVLERDDGTIYPAVQSGGNKNMRAIIFDRLYYGMGEGRRCIFPVDGEPSPWGCEERDPYQFYEWYYFSLYNLDWQWDWEDTFACYGPSCDYGVWLFFKPTDFHNASQIAGWPLEKNAYYSPEIYRLQKGAGGGPGGGPPGWIEIPEDIRWPFADAYADFGPEGDPRTTGAFFAVKFIPVGDPMQEPIRWGFPGLKSASAYSGMIVGRFDFASFGFDSFFRSVFPNTEDIIDARGIAVAHERPLAAAYSATDDSAQGATGEATYPSAGIGKLWVFGGEDLSGYRNDLWLGIPTLAGNDGEIVFSWTRMGSGQPVQDGDGAAPGSPALPPPRRDAVLVFDASSQKLILFAGFNEKGALRDLWSYDVASGMWNEEKSSQIRPILSPGYAAARYGDTIYLWDGTIRKLFTLYLPTLTFEEAFTQNSPVRLGGSAMAYDPSTKGIYLYGGYDGSSYHNDLWHLGLLSGTWKLVQPDCLVGACPALSMSSLLAVSPKGGRVVVLPSRSAAQSAGAYLDVFYARAAGQWAGARETAHDEKAGDCNGDGAVEPEFGMLCRSYSEWYDEPGRAYRISWGRIEAAGWENGP